MAPFYVRFAADSGHSREGTGRPLCAMNGHCACSTMTEAACRAGTGTTSSGLLSLIRLKRKRHV